MSYTGVVIDICLINSSYSSYIIYEMAKTLLIAVEFIALQ